MGVTIYQRVHTLYKISNLIEKVRSYDNSLSYISDRLRSGVPHSIDLQDEWDETLKEYNDTLSYFFKTAQTLPKLHSEITTINQFNTVWNEAYSQLTMLQGEMSHFSYLPENEILSVYIVKDKEILPRATLYKLAQLDYKLFSYNRFFKEVLHQYMESLSLVITENIYTHRKQLLIEVIVLIPLLFSIFILLIYTIFNYNKEAHLIIEKLGEMQRMENIGRSAGNISHDLKNMLTGIIGFTELSITDPDCPKSIKEFLTEVTKIAQQANELSTTIEHVSRENKADFAKVDLYNLLLRVKKLVNTILPKKIKFTAKLPEKNLHIWGNELQLYQLFMNLSINASHAITGNGEITMYVEVFDSKTIIRVQDTGSGIAKEHLNKIFDSGFSTKDSESGSGYGLSIVKNIVESHKGKISVTSELNKGTEFSVELPLFK